LFQERKKEKIKKRKNRKMKEKKEIKKEGRKKENSSLLYFVRFETQHRTTIRWFPAPSVCSKKESKKKYKKRKVRSMGENEKKKK